MVGKPHDGRKRQMSNAERQRRLRRRRQVAKAETIRAETKPAKVTAREARVAAMAAAAAQASADLAGLGRRYAVLLADPPWRFEPWSRETGLGRSADRHYATMDTDSIARIEVPAAVDAVLYLWAAVPMIEHALAVMNAWGFTYRSAMVWDKGRDGTGYWFRNRVEFLMVGTRGAVPAPVPGDQPQQVLRNAPGEHSAKPVAAYEMIERLFPSATKLELFARSRRDGWDAWGNEANGG